MEISGAVGVDLVTAINDYPNKGFVPMGVLSLSVQPPTPVVMPAGSSWFTQPVSVPSGVLTSTPSYDPPREPEPKEPPAPEKIIDGSVIGYRAFRIRDWLLTGTFSTVPWVPGVNEAVCDSGQYGSAWNRTHPAPHIGCACGITALARFAKTDAHWTNADVYGAIEAWSDEDGDSEHGRFILHGTGFRAQYGKVVLLAVDDEWPVAKRAAVRALAQEHGADVCKRSHLEDAAKEHGQLVPDELLEWAKDAEPKQSDKGGRVYLGGPFAQAMYNLQTTISTSSTSMSQLIASMQGLATPPKPKPGTRGVKQTLGHPGPPQGRLTTYRKGDRVRDKKGQVWRCVKGGKPGWWEAEDQQGGGS